MSLVLVAEDDATIREGLAISLESEGYGTRVCADGAEALAAYAERRPDLMLLDVMMPGESGYAVCAKVRRSDPGMPIIFLTAKSSEEDVILGLGLGADDFIAKPVRIRELLARVAAALRRGRAAAQSQTAATADASAPQGADDGRFRIGAATVDGRRFTVASEAGTHPLTVRELGLLKAFAERPGEVISRADLLEGVWGMEYAGGTRTLDQHIVQVRRKLGASGNRIETVRGVGYRLAD